jgi:lysophospholipase L1-like esterase
MDKTLTKHRIFSLFTLISLLGVLTGCVSGGARESQANASAPALLDTARTPSPAASPPGQAAKPAGGLINTDPAQPNMDPAKVQLVLPEPANPKLPSLILIGDSTVRNGRDDGQGKGKGQEGQWGWGNPIAEYFDLSKVNVVNRALGGLSSRTYVTSGRWDSTLKFIKPGDVVMLQFGHNDSSPVNDNSRARGTLRGIGDESEAIKNMLTGKDEVVHTYGWYLRKYINEIKARGAIPIVVSPIPRKMWGEDGMVPRDKARYAGWAEQVARAEKVGFIDLNERAAAKYDELGRDAVLKLFPPGEERVHPNWAGSVLNAEIVVAGLKALRGHPLNAFLNAKGRAIPAAEDDRPVVDAASVKQEAVANPKLPTLHIVGDSTVKSGGLRGMFGWGERITPYFNTSMINVVNHAIGGRSSRTFFHEKRWDKVLEQLKAGDVVLIQFGHNDGARIGDPNGKNRGSVPGIGPETVEETMPDGSRMQVHSFGWYMAKYVNDAKAKGASVVLLSPIPHKDKWQNERDFANYAEWDQQVAKAHGAYYIDLTQLVADGYRKLGASAVEGLFADARTHTNDAGAVFNAERVVAGLKALPGKPMAAYFSSKAEAVN